MEKYESMRRRQKGRPWQRPAHPLILGVNRLGERSRVLQLEQTQAKEALCAGGTQDAALVDDDEGADRPQWTLASSSCSQGVTDSVAARRGSGEAYKGPVPLTLGPFAG